MDGRRVRSVRTGARGLLLEVRADGWMSIEWDSRPGDPVDAWAALSRGEVVIEEETAMVIRGTIVTDKPTEAAEAFRLLLALEKGYSSEIRPEANGGCVVVASDGQAIRFEKA